MMNWTQFPYIMTPIGVSILVGLTILIYMSLMTISVYLPPILLISIFVGYIVYLSQRKCELQPATPSTDTSRR